MKRFHRSYLMLPFALAALSQGAIAGEQNKSKAGVPAMAQVSLPVAADYCAIYRALTNQLPADCGAPAGVGDTRSIVPRGAPKPAGTAEPTVEGQRVAVVTRGFGPQFAEVALLDDVYVYEDRYGIPEKSTRRPRPVATAPRRQLKYSTAAVAPTGKPGEGTGYFIHFAFDSTSIGDDYRAHLDSLSKVLQTEMLQKTCLKIVGHTDAVGAEQYNSELSQRRATMVRDYLVNSGGVAETRILMTGNGETTPLEGTDPEHPRNRRVEFQIREASGNC